jgi:hypothetical protein
MPPPAKKSGPSAKRLRHLAIRAWLLDRLRAASEGDWAYRFYQQAGVLNLLGLHDPERDRWSRGYRLQRAYWSLKRATATVLGGTIKSEQRPIEVNGETVQAWHWRFEPLTASTPDRAPHASKLL